MNLMDSISSPKEVKKGMFFSVRIADWDNPRQAALWDGKVFLEVAFSEHCPTCASRVHFVRGRLNGEGSWGRAPAGQAVVSLAYPTDREQSPVSAASFLSQKLGVAVAAV
jgi:hypothetical protein